MKTTPREQPGKRPDRTPEHGAPATFAAYAVRKNLSVRVLVRPSAQESDELMEHGYGHGV